MFSVRPAVGSCKKSLFFHNDSFVLFFHNPAQWKEKGSNIPHFCPGNPAPFPTLMLCRFEINDQGPGQPLPTSLVSKAREKDAVTPKLTEKNTKSPMISPCYHLHVRRSSRRKNGSETSDWYSKMGRSRPKITKTGLFP